MPIANILQPLTNVEEWVLEHLHSLGFSWGLAIVGLTVLIRLCTVPLVVRQFRSQREMKLHMPELKRLQAKHKGGDKKQLQQEMAAYYKEHGINPLASMAPLVLQIPVFISLYMLLRSDASSGVFGSGGFVFIPDLTEKATGGVLIALMAMYLFSQLASSAIATRTLQTNHRGIVMALPVLFVTVIARFPAGLAIYSITTSLWSLGQQIVFWRLSPAVPAGAAALAAEAEDVLEAGEDSKFERALEAEAASVATNGHSNGGSNGAATATKVKPATPQHSRSKKKKRSRSRR